MDALWLKKLLNLFRRNECASDRKVEVFARYSGDLEVIAHGGMGARGNHLQIRKRGKGLIYPGFFSGVIFVGSDEFEVYENIDTNGLPDSNGPVCRSGLLRVGEAPRWNI